MKTKKYDRKKMRRFAFWGALLLGMSSFAAGTFLCFYFHWPIPPLFITELGVLVGGCLGALAVTTGSEKQALPSVVAGLLGFTLSTAMGALWWQSLLTSAGGFLLAWIMSEDLVEETKAW